MTNKITKTQAKILLVDDNKNNIVALRCVLDELNVDLIEALSGEQALRLALENNLALILLDVQMPGMNGFEVAGFLRKNAKTRAIPIIFVTAINKEMKYIHKGHELGAVDYIFKPIDPQVLQSKVTVFLDYYHQKKEMQVLLDDLSATKKELELSNQQLYKLAHLDLVTGLSNRRNFETFLDSALLEAKKNNQLLGLLYLDLDDFKFVNDTHGHALGDDLLRQVSHQIYSCIRATDTLHAPNVKKSLSRLGGDEFGLILTEMLEPSNAGVVAQRIIQSFSRRIDLGGTKVQVGVSIGIACFPEAGDTSAKLQKAADAAMYKAKSKGKNNFQYFSEELNQQNDRLVLLEKGLRDAINNNELSLVYQPILDLSSNQIVACEAFCRWDSAELGTVLPDEFIPVAEKMGYINELGRWVCDQAITEMDKYIVPYYPSLQCHVNLSIKQLECDAFFEFLNERLRLSTLKKEQMVFELTETALMSKNLTTEEKVAHLCQLGYKISLDDFGTGYSSLGRLKRLSLSSIKLDKSFVNTSCRDENTAVILKTMVNMAKTMGIQSIAEGVEDEEQLAFLRKIGCDCVQGFVIDKPTRCEIFLNFLKISCDNNRA